MILQEIIVANGASVIILLILLISRLMTRHRARWVDIIFSILIYIGITCAILETVSFIIDGVSNTALRVLNIGANTILYGCNATISVLWVLYVDLSLNKDKKKSKALYIPLLVICAGLLLSLIFNLFFGFLFSVDANNVYHRQPAGYIFYVFLIASFIISIIMYIKSRFVHGEAQFFPIWMFLTPVILSCIIQAVFYGIAAAWLGCAIGLLGIYVNLQSKLVHVDSLTGLFNRAYVEHKLIMARSSKRYVYSGIMLDIDYFKNINDEYGHSSGDKALSEAANILLTACDRQAIPFRFAGDEFIVLIKVPVNKKDELESKTQDIIKRIIEEADKYNSTKEDSYQIVFSIGHSVFNPNQPDDIFFHQMDTEMYKEKRKHHQEHQ